MSDFVKIDKAGTFQISRTVSPENLVRVDFPRVRDGLFEDDRPVHEVGVRITYQEPRWWTWLRGKVGK